MACPSCWGQGARLVSLVPALYTRLGAAQMHVLHETGIGGWGDLLSTSGTESL